MTVQEQKAGIELYYRLKSGSKRVAEWFLQMQERIKSALGDTGTALKQSSTGYEKHAQAVKKVGAAVDGVTPSVKGISEEWMGLGRQLLDATGSADDTVAALRQMGASAQEAEAIVGALTGTTQQAAQAQQQAAKATQTQTTATEQAAQATQTQTQAVQTQAQTSRQYIQGLRQQLQAQQQVTQAQQGATQASQRSAKISQVMTRLYGQQAKAVQQVTQPTQQLTAAQFKVKEALVALQPEWVRQGNLINATVQDYQRVVGAGRELGHTHEYLSQMLGISTDKVAELEKAFKKSTKSSRRYSFSLQRLVKILGFWLVMGQVYFAVLNLQRALAKTFKEVHGHTQEARDFKEAINGVGVALTLLATGTDINGFLEDLTERLDGATRGFLLLRAAIEAAGQEDFFDPQGGGLVDFLNAAGEELFGGEPGRGIGQRIADALTEGLLAIGPDFDNALKEIIKAWEEGASRLSDIEKEKFKTLQQQWALEEQLLQDQITAWQQYWQQMEDDALDHNRKMEEIQRDYDRAVEDAETDYRRRVEDIERDGANRRAEIERDFYDQRQKYIDQYNLRVWDTTWQHNRSMLRLEQNYQRELRAIQRRYEETMWEAISTRNATMALQATRKRNEDIKEAKIQYEEDKDNEIAEYQHRLELLRRQLELRLKYLRENRQQDLEDLRRNMKEQREEARIQRDRDLEDAETARKRQEDDEKQSYQRRLDDLAHYHKRKMDELVREYKWEVKLLWDAYRAYVDHADAEYRAGVIHTNRMVALMRRLAAAKAGIFGGGPTSPGNPYSSPGNPYSGPYDTYSGPYDTYFQHGGSMIATRPQTIHVGEGNRPELVQVTPLSGTTQHQVSLGDLNARVNATVEQSITGYEGRMQAAFSELARQLFR